MKYIAYGSNMIKEQMSYRCPNAQLIGMGYLTGHKLEFYLHATVMPCEDKDARVPVAVWEIDRRDEMSLDRYEGYPNYYTKETCTVQMLDGSQIEGMVYIMRWIRVAPPSEIYYHGIRSAYIELGMQHEIKKVLAPALRRSKRRGVQYLKLR